MHLAHIQLASPLLTNGPSGLSWVRKKPLTGNFFRRTKPQQPSGLAPKFSPTYAYLGALITYLCAHYGSVNVNELLENQFKDFLKSVLQKDEEEEQNTSASETLKAMSFNFWHTEMKAPKIINCFNHRPRRGSNWGADYKSPSLCLSCRYKPNPVLMNGLQD